MSRAHGGAVEPGAAAGLAGDERRLAFRDLYVLYARLHVAT
jgi:hypothetical protein